MHDKPEEYISGNAKKFVKSSDKYEDLNSSGITLIFTSVAGFIFMILKTMGIIPLYYSGVSNIMFYIVMGGMFCAFFVTGVMSLKKAGKIKAGIADEENTESRIIEFFASEYTPENIDDNIGAAALSEGDLYYKRYDYLKSEINGNFPDIDDSFAEHLIEEIYPKLFEST